MSSSELDLDALDIAVQTSLEFIEDKKKAELEEELQQLRDDKYILEGKVRGYLALSKHRFLLQYLTNDWM